MDSPKALASHRGAKIVLIAAVMILTVMALNTALHYWNIRRLAETRDLVIRSSEKLRAANQLYTSLQDAETGQRGFLLTGDKSYLEPYERGTKAVENNIQTLRQLVEVSPEQKTKLTALEPLLKKKMEELAHSIKTYDEQGAEAARALVLTDAGKQAMDSLRGVLSSFEQTERDTDAKLVELSEQSTLSTL